MFRRSILACSATEVGGGGGACAATKVSSGEKGGGCSATKVGGGEGGACSPAGSSPILISAGD